MNGLEGLKHMETAIVPPSPAARRLDALDVQVRAGDEVWVRFQSFKAGIKEKVAVA